MTLAVPKEPGDPGIPIPDRTLLSVPEHFGVSADRPREDPHCFCADPKLLQMVPDREDLLSGANPTLGLPAEELSGQLQGLDQ